MELLEPSPAPAPQLKRERQLRPCEVRAMFRAAGIRIADSTLRYWAKTGKLASSRTPGNHRRYPASSAQALCRSMLAAA